MIRPALRPWTRVLACAAAAVLAAGRGEAATCQPTRLAALGINLTPNNTVLVPVEVNGRPAVFQLDTGAKQSLVAEGLARSLGLLRSMSAMPLLVGASGRPIREYAMARTLAMAGLVRHPVLLVVVPDATIVDAQATGLVGASFVSNWDLELDVAAGRMAFYSPDDCRAGVVPWSRHPGVLPMRVGGNRRVTIPVTLDGKSLEALIDTGASHTVMATGAASRLFRLQPGQAGVAPKGETTTSDGGRLATYGATFKTLTIGPITFRDPAIDLVEMRDMPDEDLPYDLILGVDQIERLHLYLAYSERTLYVTAR